VTKAKLAPTGGTAGQVLGTDGSNLTWQPDGLTLPYNGTANSTVPVIAATNTGGAAGLAGSGGIAGVEGLSSAGIGVGGISQKGPGVLGLSADGGVPSPFPVAGVLGGSSGSASFGVFGVSDQGLGVLGVSGRIDPSLLAAPPAVGVFGASDTSDGVMGTTTGTNTYGVHGESLYEGVFGNNGAANTNGCLGCPTAGAVGYTANASAFGVIGSNVAGGVGIQGNSTAGGGGIGVQGNSIAGGVGVEGNSTNSGGATGPGVLGVSPASYGVEGLTSTVMGVYGKNQATNNDGCLGCQTDGVVGFTNNPSFHGVHGNNIGGSGGIGVWGTGDYGVFGGGGTHGVYGTGTGYGVYGTSSSGYGVYCNGSGGYTGSWSNLSDRRLKRDVATLADSLAKVLQLRGVSFAWRADEFPEKHFNTGQQIGFIAQEVEPILPEVVTTDPDGYRSLDYSKLTPILTEAIKEQQATIEAQRAELQRLSGEMESTKDRFAKLEKLLATFEERLPAPAPASPR